MATFPCPYCGHALTSTADLALDRCPRCDGSLLIAYRYRLVESHGRLGGGVLYRAVDDGFGESVAVSFVADPKDAAAVERFIEGHRLFADLGGCGLIRILEVGSARDPRPYVVMDWLAGGTLDKLVAARGPLAQASLLELVGDLLTGMSKAHRAMPVIVHGHIHPGKIGFRAADEAVLLGFEHARQINAQASRLAYAFTPDPDADEAGRAGDLRALGLAFYYAASGEWLGDRTLRQQRERVRAELPGPLGRLVDRLLGAGEDGYVSAVEAAFDFDSLRQGVDGWQGPRVIAQPRLDAPMGTAWGGKASSIASADLDGDGEPDWDDDDEDDGGDEPEPWPAASAANRGASGPSQPASEPAPDYAAWAARESAAQARGRSPAPAPKPGAGRLVVVGVGMLVMMGVFVAGILEEVASDLNPPPPPSFEPRVAVEPIPREVREPEPPPRFEEPAPEPAVSGLAGTFKYTATVTGPPTVAGLALGDSCEIWVYPVDAGGGLNCRWAIDCGQPRKRIYGGGDAGYSRCRVDAEGWPDGAQDEDDDAADGAFFADLASEPSMLIVLDRWLLPPVNAILTVDAGGLTQQPVPGTPQAARIERAEIERRIAADDYPELVAAQP